MAIIMHPVDQAGGSPLSVEMPVNTSQTIVKGDVLTQDTDGVRVALSNDGQIFGIAAQGITTGSAVDRTDKIMVWVGGENIYKSVATAAIASAFIGDACDLNTEATDGTHRVAPTVSTESVFQIVELPTIDDGGTYADYLHFRVIRSQYGQSLAALG